MENLFEKYGNYYIEFKPSLEKSLAYNSPTLYELKEALYQEFKERLKMDNERHALENKKLSDTEINTKLAAIKVIVEKNN